MADSFVWDCSALWDKMSQRLQRIECLSAVNFYWKEQVDLMKEIPFEIVNPGATEEEIAALEKCFHFQMPQDLREFYLKHNGAVFPSGAQLNPEYCQLRHFYSIGRQYQDYIDTINRLLEWQEMDKLIPMCYIPFCADEANDSYYIRVDEDGYGEIHYIVDFLDNSDIEGVGLIANSFKEFWEQIEFS